VTALVVAAPPQTRLTRLPGFDSCGTRTHTIPEAFATSIAATRSMTCSCSSSTIPCGSLITRALLHPLQRTRWRDARGPRSGTEILPGALEAAVHDPSRSGPGARLAHGLEVPEKQPVSAGNPVGLENTIRAVTLYVPRSEER